MPVDRGVVGVVGVGVQSNLRLLKHAPLLLAAMLMAVLPPHALLVLHARAEHGGDQDSYSAICAVARDENNYILEWVEYHKCLGIGKIYLYDHGSAEPMSNQITEHIDSGFVHYIPFRGEHTKLGKDDGYADNLTKFSRTIQGKVYKDCLDNYATRHRFIGFIDPDEFLVLHDQSITSVDELLKRYEPYGGVSFYWVLFGSGGHRLHATDWVTRAYTKCTRHTSNYNTQFKSFLNTALQPTMYSPHRAMFGAETNTSYLVDENEARIPSGRNKNSTHGIAAVYHYVTKSKQDFEKKMQRGGGAGVTRPRDYLRKLDLACTEVCHDAALTYERLCGAEEGGGSGSRSGGGAATVGAVTTGDAAAAVGAREGEASDSSAVPGGGGEAAEQLQRGGSAVVVQWPETARRRRDGSRNAGAAGPGSQGGAGRTGAATAAGEAVPEGAAAVGAAPLAGGSGGFEAGAAAAAEGESSPPPNSLFAIDLQLRLQDRLLGLA
ncbi:hypothetical protein FOA52_007728 [Chlamydomonas sp. UWO 241]|nr:hypothetical protein FOA52_007728 [Chlamydomonas sp. UWO 241]